MGDKMSQIQNVKVKKNKTISHVATIFHNFALKIETAWVTRMVKPILKLRNVNDNAR